MKLINNKRFIKYISILTLMVTTAPSTIALAEGIDAVKNSGNTGLTSESTFNIEDTGLEVEQSSVDEPPPEIEVSESTENSKEQEEAPNTNGSTSEQTEPEVAKEIPSDEVKIRKKRALSVPKSGTPANVGVDSPEVKGVKLEQVRVADENIVSGTGPFDADDKPGNDSSDTNFSVRTFDSIRYLATFNLKIDPNANIEKVHYRFDVSVLNAVTYEDGNIRQNAKVEQSTWLSEPDANKTQRASAGVTSTSTGSGYVGLPVKVNVLGAKNGTVLKTETAVTVTQIDYKDGRKETVNITSPLLYPHDIKVSAKPTLHILTYMTNSTTHELNQVLNKPDEDAFGIQNEMIFAMIPFRPNRDYRGATYPSGKITVTSQVKKYNHSGVSEANYIKPTTGVEYFDTIGLITTNTNSGSNFTNTQLNDRYKGYKVNSFNNGGFKYAPYSEDRSPGKLRDDAVYYSGSQTKVDRTGVDLYTVTLDGQNYMDKKVNTPGETSTWQNKRIFGVTNTYLKANRKGTPTADINFYTYITEIKDADGNVLNDVQGQKSHGAYLTASFNGLTHYTASYQDNLAKGFLTSNGSYSWKADGTIRAVSNYPFFASMMGNDNGLSIGTVDMISFFNPDSFEIDKTKGTNAIQYNVPVGQSALGTVTGRKYGVLKNGQKYATNSYYEDVNNRYNWFNSIAEAEKTGQVSASWGTFKKTSPERAFKPYIRMYLIPTSIHGTKNAKGTHNTIMGTQRITSTNGTSKTYAPSKATANNFTPVDDTNKPETNTFWQGSDNPWGETVTVVPAKASLSVAVDSGAAVKGKEETTWRAEITNRHDNRYQNYTNVYAELDKGLKYVPSSTTYNNKAFGEPVETIKPNGKTLLTWKIDLKDRPIANDNLRFKTRLDHPNMKYNTMNKQTLTTTIWVQAEGKDGVLDYSTSRFTKGDKSIEATKIDQVLTNTENVTPKIEIGVQDKAASTATQANTGLTGLALDKAQKPQTMIYNATLKNDTNSTVNKPDIVVQFPIKANDARNSYTGSLVLDKITVKAKDMSKIKVKYKTEPITNPNMPLTATGWYDITPDKLGKDNLNIASYGVYVGAPNLTAEESIEVEVQLKPKNTLKPEEVFQPKVNLALDGKNNIIALNKTNVVQRNVKGNTWLDLGLNDQIDDKSVKSEGVPVKVLRTSTINKSIKEEVLTEDMKGNKLVDSKGNPTTKTNKDGLYNIENLPEGDYKFQFNMSDVYDEELLIPVKQNTDMNNPGVSRIDDTYTTETIKLPANNDIALKDNKLEVKEVNAGVVMKSRIKVTDTIDGIQPNSGIEYQIKEGDKVVYTGKTNKKGELITDKPLLPGDYVVIPIADDQGKPVEAKPTPISIKGDGEEIQVEYNRTRENIIPPKTGVSILLPIMLTMFIISLILMLRRNRKV